MKKFKKIKNYETYVINEDGQVFSNKTNTLLRPGKSKNGYKSVVLSNIDGTKTFEIHQLVWDTFMNDSREGRKGLVIDHINEIKTDNNIMNLQKITQSENCIKSITHRKQLREKKI